ncbi:oxidative damage protection protein [Alcaligenes endophyticus]|uniref:Probable Fe(2+)-trafficking protein n=1 Tax=Alcaligenes endophyticus TaxID=1929088 RepID=A0ABT8ENE2_9BURK|nr:oxidative damage protection protein [Alcaligenes endophyticus]MCX5591306.1 oxidative damage protection protein [Alcaligenes endophyticus]MDN4122813.1 oxidative damage protection protein [Alcaligenes endophyticus]
MTRMVQCVKLKQEAEGLEFPPYPGDLGVKIWQSISKQAWANWIDIQTRLVNENRLNLADTRARKYLKEQMEKHLFEDIDVEAQGYVAPPL